MGVPSILKIWEVNFWNLRPNLYKKRFGLIIPFRFEMSHIFGSYSHIVQRKIPKSDRKWVFRPFKKFGRAIFGIYVQIYVRIDLVCKLQEVLKKVKTYSFT